MQLCHDNAQAQGPHDLFCWSIFFVAVEMLSEDTDTEQHHDRTVSFTLE
jgi:hypothetical protein